MGNVYYGEGYNRDYDCMMTRATIIYNQMPWSIGKQDLARNRCEIAEAIVGEDLAYEQWSAAAWFLERRL